MLYFPLSVEEVVDSSLGESVVIDPIAKLHLLGSDGVTEEEAGLAGDKLGDFFPVAIGNLRDEVGIVEQLNEADVGAVEVCLVVVAHHLVLPLDDPARQRRLFVE